MVSEATVLKPTPATLKRLYALSGNQCARPGCEQQLIGAGGENHGRACHIHGERKGSARWVEWQTPEERRAFENLILLCEKCHTTIDSELTRDRFSPGLLRHWKSEHEAAWVSDELALALAEGKRVSSSVAQSLTGLFIGLVQNSEIHYHESASGSAEEERDRDRGVFARIDEVLPEGFVRGSMQEFQGQLTTSDFVMRIDEGLSALSQAGNTFLCQEVESARVDFRDRLWEVLEYAAEQFAADDRGVRDFTFCPDFRRDPSKRADYVACCNRMRDLAQNAERSYVTFREAVLKHLRI